MSKYIGTPVVNLSVDTVDVTGDITAPGTVTFNSYTTTEKNALSAVAGMTVYDSTLNRLSYYNGTGWVDLA